MDAHRKSSISSSNDQVYLSGRGTVYHEPINRYLNSKNSKLSLTIADINSQYRNNFGVSLTNKQMEQIFNKTVEYMNNGTEISAGVYYTPKKAIRFIDMETNNVQCTTFDWGEGGRTCGESNRYSRRWINC